LSEPSHRLDQLIDLRVEQRLPIAGLNGFHLSRAGCAEPILDCHSLRTAMNREPQIVRLATQHEIQRIDRSSIEEGVTVATGTVVLRDRIPPITPVDLIGVIADSVVTRVIACTAVSLPSPPSR
jgi:hypothetical protein